MKSFANNQLTTNHIHAHSEDEYTYSEFAKAKSTNDDQEKLALFMVENGMLTEELATQALYLGKKHSIGFDEAIVYLEKSNARKSKKPSSKSNLSGIESSILRRLVENSLLSTEQAAQVVKQSLYKETSVIDILCQFEILVKPQKLESYAVTLLINSNLIDDETNSSQIKFENSKKFRPLVLLIAKGKISIYLERASLNCALFVNKQEMTLQEAKLILRYIAENKVSFTEALEHLGLSYSETKIDDKNRDPELSIQIREKLQTWSQIVYSKIGYQS